MALINGDNSRNVITGTPESDTIFGFGGDDELIGGSGNDYIDGGPGNDLLGIMVRTGDIEPGDDVYQGGSGDDQIGAGLGSDTIFGGPGNDTIFADGLLIRGFFGAPDWVSGGPGSDVIFGSYGRSVAYFELPRRSYTVQSPDPMQLQHPLTVTVGSGASSETDTLSGFQILQFVDGRSVTLADDPLSHVYRVFEAGLDRKPDPIGLNLWGAQIAAGLPLDAFAAAVVASPELQSRFGTLDDQAFVQRIHQNAYGRPGEEAEIAVWVAELDTGASRGEVLMGFTDSSRGALNTAKFFAAGVWDQDEQAAQTARLYDTVFNRLPDLNGFLANKAALDAGLSLEQLAHNYMESAEFTARYGRPDVAPEALVNALYSNALGRPAEPDGFACWTGELRSGALNKEQVIIGISESLEHQIVALPAIEGGIAFT
jgi:Ca2+-binding RTX toxin-like protein